MDTPQSPCPDSFASSEASGSTSNRVNASSPTSNSMTDQEEQEDQEDSSSTILASDDESEGDENDLENFRKQWKDEVDAKKAEDLKQDSLLQVHDNSSKKLGKNETEETLDFFKARQLFLEGVELEQKQEHFEAILKYKKAVQLVPDIEFQTFEYNRKQAQKEMVISSNENKSFSLNSEDVNDHEDTLEGLGVDEDLIKRFSNLNLNQNAVCEPEMESNVTHISALPFELVIQILRWVISSELDLRSLERCSLICRGFFLACRSSDLWRLICLNTWGMNHLPLQCLDWRSYYLTRPKVLLPGCYMARMSYAREGERGFQDNEFYRSWHMVQYFRYLRFFAGGKLMMLTSADEPLGAVKILNKKHGGNAHGIMQGHYRMSLTNIVNCVVKKPYAVHKMSNNNQFWSRRARNKGNEVNLSIPDQEFHFELEIRGKKFNRLHWLKYKVVNVYNNGEMQSSDIDVMNNSTFPPLCFSRVQSYQTHSECPLH